MITPVKETSLLDMPNGTVLEFQVYKPHGGKVQVIAVASNGDYKVLFDYSLNAQPLIDKNMKNENLKPIPKDWPTTDHIPKPEPVRDPEMLKLYADMQASQKAKVPTDTKSGKVL